VTHLRADALCGRLVSDVRAVSLPDVDRNPLETLGERQDRDETRAGRAAGPPPPVDQRSFVGLDDVKGQGEQIASQ
jgi:hypothetical protein